MHLNRLKLAIKYKQKRVSWGTRLYCAPWLSANSLLFSVCRASQCPAVISLNLVRGPSGIQTEEHATAGKDKFPKCLNNKKHLMFTFRAWRFVGWACCFRCSVFATSSLRGGHSPKQWENPSSNSSATPHHTLRSFVSQIAIENELWEHSPNASLASTHKRLLVFWLEFLLLLFHTPINSILNEIINQVSHAAHKIIFSSVLLILASQRIEDIMGWDLTTDTTKRGSLPSAVEYCILAWVAGLIWSEIKQLWDVGLKVRLDNGAWFAFDRAEKMSLLRGIKMYYRKAETYHALYVKWDTHQVISVFQLRINSKKLLLQEYASDLWNVVDFVTNSLYVATIGLRIRAFCDVSYLPWKSNLYLFPLLFPAHGGN